MTPAGEKGTGAPITPWRRYLEAPQPEGAYRACHYRCAPALRRLRRTIARVVERTRPRTVACLGAGVLNDIPYRTLVRSGAAIHLVDWVPGAVESGVAMSLIDVDEAGQAHCVYCDLDDAAARAYCRRFHPAGGGSRKACESFAPGAGGPATCAAFARGERPILHREDATGGYASAFGQAVGAELAGVRSWRQAFARATAAARRVRRHRQSLTVPEAAGRPPFAGA